MARAASFGAASISVACAKLTAVPPADGVIVNAPISTANCDALAANVKPNANTSRPPNTHGRFPPRSLSRLMIGSSTNAATPPTVNNKPASR
jgi:hypothetical protein